MTTNSDPTADPAATYDYQGGSIERPDLVADLEARIDGDVRFDEFSRELYATDASNYRVTPVGVVFPKTTADVAATVTYCAEQSIPVLPRGGGTSLAGQTTNRAVVIDFTRHMDTVQSVDPERQCVRAQPGITIAHLNQAVADEGLKFAPDPAWGDKSALGGAIGNNSTGAHSLQYGKTDAYIESAEVVLADGTVTTFESMSLEELRAKGDPEGSLEERIYAGVADIVDTHGDAIEDQYPDLKRNVSGYNLDLIVEEARETGAVNLARLLAGSEGTLGIVTEAEVSLVEIPETTSMALLAYENLIDAVSDVKAIVEHDAAAVELVDDVLLELAADTPKFATLVDMLPEGTGAVLLVEMAGPDEVTTRNAIAELLADRCPSHDPDGTVPSSPHESDTPVNAFAALEAHDQATQDRFWKLRKAGLPILLSRMTDEKHIAFIEDTAIPPENLPEYVADFQDILAEHDTFASFYAHAGPGVLHIRPLIDTKSAEGIERMDAIADAVTDLVVEYGGSVSGEHGDGRARTQFNRKLYGEEVYSLFHQLKSTFDPDWLLNPGQVVSPPDDPTDLTEHLRYGAEYTFEPEFDPTLQWDNDNGFEGMVELCHGCGGCRGHQDTTGGVMCPTYRAAEEESLSTRGRANMLRSAISGDVDVNALDDEFMSEILDLCIGCKGCKHDCPSGVDMAKLKAEVTHQHHQESGISIRDRLFGNFETVARIGSALAPLSNWAQAIPGAGKIAEATLGIASERTFPQFARRPFHKRVADHEPAVSAAEAERRAIYLPDIYTNYLHPEVGEAAVALLEAAGVHVDIADPLDVGRPAYSKGLLDRSRSRAKTAVETFAPAVREGWDVVLAEPSDAVMVQNDFLDLLAGEDVERVAANTYGVCEYLDQFDLDAAVDFDAPDRSLAYHGHCHQKATAKDHHAVGVLRRAGYTVDALDSTCCGMAGSFGYEAEHYSMSRSIAGLLADQIDASEAETVVAPGTSCRSQLEDLDIAEPPTPIEALAAALPDRAESI